MRTDYDVIVLGGGAAGMMSAISLHRHHPELSVAILDRTFALGRKILVCGAGRCNITNINLGKEIEKRYYGASPEFIRSILDQFGYDEIVKFFNELGVELYVERKTNIGKLFPVTDQAKTITTMLQDEIDRAGIDIHYNTHCEDVTPKKDNFTVKAIDITDPKNRIPKEYHAKYLIISAGGKTYPAFGSDGSGYSLVEKLGHSIVKPVPSALSLEGKNPLSQQLQGTKMEMEATSIIDNKEVKTRVDDVMFKKYGLSGPAILNISREISVHINREGRKNAFVKLNFFPGKTKEEVRLFLDSRWERRPDQTTEMSLVGIFPTNIPAQLLNVAAINKDKKVNGLTTKEKTRLLGQLTDTRIKITATRGWNEAEFTAGGVNTKEINPLTLESKKVPNLYFAGEIMDVDGDVGGFNLSWSWASGFTAGKLQ